MGRNYKTEILQALQSRSRDAVALGFDLRIHDDILYSLLIKLIENGSIIHDKGILRVRVEK